MKYQVKMRRVTVDETLIEVEADHVVAAMDQAETLMKGAEGKWAVVGVTTEEEEHE